MPSAETGIALDFVFLGDTGFVKSGMGGVFERSSCEAFVISHSTVADELNLGNSGDGLDVQMKNGLLCGINLIVAMCIALRLRIKSLEVVVVTKSERAI